MNDIASRFRPPRPDEYLWILRRFLIPNPLSLLLSPAIAFPASPRWIKIESYTSKLIKAMCVCIQTHSRRFNICHSSKHQTRSPREREVTETIIQRNHNTFSSSDMRYIRISFCPIYVATLDCHYKFNTRSKLYTTISFQCFCHSKITQEMFYCIRRHEQKKRVSSPRWNVRRNIPQTRTCRLYHLRRRWASNWNRQLQSRESNWLWHENRIIIIRPLYQIDLWTCQIFAQATNGTATQLPSKSEIYFMHLSYCTSLE